MTNARDYEMSFNLMLCASGKLRKSLCRLRAHVWYLISEFTDELSVVVVRFDDVCLAASKMRGTLNEVRPQGALGQENLFWFQIHSFNHFIGHL